MKDQLVRLMRHLGLTATRFADEIGVQRSGISHILSGRNQPSYDFIVKITNRFPEINLEWLMLGKGNMIKNRDSDFKPEADLFSQTASGETHQNKKEVPVEITGHLKEIQRPENKLEVTDVTSIKQVLLLLSDGTFKSFDPATQD